MHKMSKESAASLAAAYGEVAKWREAFDICIQYIEILNNKYPQYKELRKKVNSETKNWIQSNYNKNSK